MASFPNELQKVDTTLLDTYYVRTHTGQKYAGVGSILNFILEWLKPDNVPILNDPIEAIQKGHRFDPKDGLDLYLQLFNDQIIISEAIIEDFSKYPMRSAFTVTGKLMKPLDLLKGYIMSKNRREYFQEVTGEPASNFLNETERVFYLTHGYGRPNKFISPIDLKYRKLIMASEGSALIALIDILEICPSNQNPSLVLEKLSDFNLRSIDKFHLNTIGEVNECFRCNSVKQPSCGEGFPTIIYCFENLLKKIGALPAFDYDPTENVFRSNLSELNLYQKVIPDRKWSFELVKDMPNTYIQGVIQTLSDSELATLTVPSGASINMDLSRLPDRSRSSLLQIVLKFLTQPQYYSLPTPNQFVYGRLADSQLQSISGNELVESIRKHGALIDPYGHPITIATAQMLNEQIANPIITEIIEKTRKRSKENETVSNKAKLRDAFIALLNYDLNLDDLKEILKTNRAMNLILWSNGPIAMSFQEYYRLWYPLYSDIIRKTLEYYRIALQT